MNLTFVGGGQLHEIITVDVTRIGQRIGRCAKLLTLKKDCSGGEDVGVTMINALAVSVKCVTIIFAYALQFTCEPPHDSKEESF